MNPFSSPVPYVAIACGGTGGHLFPGMAVAEQLRQHGCDVALLISPKDIDQQAVKSARNLEVFTLPAVGLQNRNYLSFAFRFGKSFRAAQKLFQRRRPCAVLAMGGFTSAPPVLAARLAGIKTFLHVCGVSRDGGAVARPQSHRHRHAGSAAISVASACRMPEGAGVGSRTADGARSRRKSGSHGVESDGNVRLANLG
jgi:hypothetical protein